MRDPSQLVHPKHGLRRQARIPLLVRGEQEIHVPRRLAEPEHRGIFLAESVSAIPVLRHAGIPGEARSLGHVFLLGAAERNPYQIQSNIGAGSLLQPLCLEFGDPEQTLPSRR